MKNHELELHIFESTEDSIHYNAVFKEYAGTLIFYGYFTKGLEYFHFETKDDVHSTDYYKSKVHRSLLNYVHEKEDDRVSIHHTPINQ